MDYHYIENFIYFTFNYGVFTYLGEVSSIYSYFPPRISVIKFINIYFCTCSAARGFILLYSSQTLSTDNTMLPYYRSSYILRNSGISLLERDMMIYRKIT
jgi:hypothetical protein